MLGPGDRVLVAVSGGPDSVALLGVLHRLAPRLRITLHAAHFNHRWRGAESDRDQACAAAVAAQLGVGCTIGTGTGPARTNAEARAREQRYAFLAAVAKEHECTKIATGHTRDDQAETVLMRLLRGTGVDGLAGIRPVRDGHIVRPLIESTLAQVLAFLQAAGLAYCDDSSNADRRFLRSRVRHEVLPLLQAINPEASRHLAALAEVLAEEGGELESRAAPMLRDAEDASGGLTIAALRAAPPALMHRIIRAWLRRQRGDLAHLGAAHVRAIADLVRGRRPNAQVRLPSGHVVMREYDTLRFRATTAVTPAATAGMTVTHVVVPGTTLRIDGGWRISAEAVAASTSLRMPADVWTLVADAADLATPLVVRSVRPGDRIRPFGMRGHRKLQDVFIDRKVVPAQRRTWPVVEAGGEILWLPGIVRGAQAPVTSGTRSVLRLVAERTRHKGDRSALP